MHSGYHGSPMDPMDVYDWQNVVKNDQNDPSAFSPSRNRSDIEMGQVPNLYFGGGRATVTRVLDAPRSDAEHMRKRGRESQRAKDRGWYDAFKDVIGVGGRGSERRRGMSRCLVFRCRVSFLVSKEMENGVTKPTSSFSRNRAPG